jgi:hypothetical protein
MARVFVSYAKSERDLTRAVVALLEAAGHTVWWDTELVSGETYRDALDRELDAADAVVVIWTPSSVRSSWVIAEADHGLRLDKLVPLRTDGLETWQIPKPFGTFHTELASDRDALIVAVNRCLKSRPEHSSSNPSAAQPRRDAIVAGASAETQVSTFLTLLMMLLAGSAVLISFWVRSGALDKVTLLAGASALGIVMLSIVATQRGLRTRNSVYAGLKVFNWSTFALYGWGAASLVAAYWPNLQNYRFTLAVCTATMAIAVIIMLAQSRGAPWVLTTAQTLAAVQIIWLGLHVARQIRSAIDVSGWLTDHPEANLHVLYLATGLAGIAISIIFLIASYVAMSSTVRRTGT